jgi:hypothetical protein
MNNVWLRKNLRYLILVVAVIAAVATPTPSPKAMLMFMAPALALFCVSLIVKAFKPKLSRSAFAKLTSADNLQGFWPNASVRFCAFQSPKVRKCRLPPEYAQIF